MFFKGGTFVLYLLVTGREGSHDFRTKRKQQQ